MDRLCEKPHPEGYDLLVVGGGINGVGIARDAAGRGLRVLLCDQGDLGGATSSASSKLIHGGLRYLEYGEFRLVREALAEREVLLRNARHIIWPMRFRLPHRPELRPAWQIQLGLLLYDHLSRRNTLEGSRTIRLNSDSSLQPAFKIAFEYADGWVDDARLVILNALSAHQLGASIRPRTRCIHAHRQGQHWLVTLQNAQGQQEQIRASALVNACGPWVSRFYPEVLQRTAPAEVRLVKGSHIVLPRLGSDEASWILQTDDQRIVFVIPFENHFSLVGTTDIELSDSIENLSISDSETSYLLAVVNQHFRCRLQPKDVIDSFAGVRPLLDNAANEARAVTRDYQLELEQPDNRAPLLSVFGGKITTYRKLAETAVNTLASGLPVQRETWTANTPLPGGNFDSQPRLHQQLAERFPWLPTALLSRYVRSYGTLCTNFLVQCKSLQDMGIDFGEGLYEQEIRYLCQHEWARTADDILWRRSKLGLHLSQVQQNRLNEWLKTVLSAENTTLNVDAPASFWQ